MEPEQVVTTLVLVAQQCNLTTLSNLIVCKAAKGIRNCTGYGFIDLANLEYCKTLAGFPKRLDYYAALYGKSDLLQTVINKADLNTLYAATKGPSRQCWKMVWRKLEVRGPPALNQRLQIAVECAAFFGRRRLLVELIPTDSTWYLCRFAREAAVRAGRLDVLESMPISCSYEWRSCASLAVWLGKTEILSWLLDQPFASLPDVFDRAIAFSPQTLDWLLNFKLTDCYYADSLAATALQSSFDCFLRVLPHLPKSVLQTAGPNLIKICIEGKNWSDVERLLALGAAWGAYQLSWAIDTRITPDQAFQLIRQGCPLDDAIQAAIEKSWQVDDIKKLLAAGATLTASCLVSSFEEYDRSWIEWLLDNGCPSDQMAMEKALAAGWSLVDLKWLCSRGCPIGSESLAMALRRSNLEAVAWLVDQGVRHDRLEGHVIHTSGHWYTGMITATPDLLQVLLDHGHPLTLGWLWQDAITHQDKPMLKWIARNVQRVPIKGHHRDDCHCLPRQLQKLVHKLDANCQIGEKKRAPRPEPVQG